jgi:hypothetical protein
MTSLKNLDFLDLFSKYRFLPVAVLDVATDEKDNPAKGGGGRGASGLNGKFSL